MRSGINSAVAIAKGAFIMKCDAHCMFDKGFDLKLQKHCSHGEVIVPRRKRLNAEKWEIEEGKPDIDYMYLSKDLRGRSWEEKNADEQMKAKKIDDLMAFQGSCWFMYRSYFYDLELMDEENYGQSGNEAQEIALKCWLSGGRCLVNKNTWYAHLHKKEMNYKLEKGTKDKSRAQTEKWRKKGWHKQTKYLQWLIDKFYPVPTW